MEGTIKADHQVTVLFSSNEVYKGLWIQNIRDGSGKFYYSNGDVYQGEWQDDLKEGQGAMFYANGSKFTG